MRKKTIWIIRVLLVFVILLPMLLIGGIGFVLEGVWQIFNHGRKDWLKFGEWLTKDL